MLLIVIKTTVHAIFHVFVVYIFSMEIQLQLQLQQEELLSTHERQEDTKSMLHSKKSYCIACWGCRQAVTRTQRPLNSFILFVGLFRHKVC